MRTRALALVIGLALVGTTLGGCASFDLRPRTTQQRTVSDASAIELATAGSLNVALGSEPSLTITAGEHIIDRLTADVDDGVLRLGQSGDSHGYVGEIRYDLVVTEVSSITVRGSGDARLDFTGAEHPEIVVKGSGSVDASGVDAESVSLAVDGSGEITVEDATAEELRVSIDGPGAVSISGDIDTQQVELRGSGEFEAADLRTVETRVVLRGSGEARITVSGDLEAVIDGSGEISYSGDARVAKDIAGSGELLHD